MAKPHTTRTYGPIHFEDLDPKRFEDLVRQLIYDFKDWKSIEGVGRAGDDSGFDVRAYEKATDTSEAESEDEEVTESHPMEGNLWMIQGKREKEIGPKRVKDIIDEVDKKNPPYGYILAASANFSKESQDVFREELRKKGVMEFYLWGKSELEGMLYLPKNDRILFTFFGLSFVSKRRSRTTEVRAAVLMKNRSFKALGSGDLHQHALIRDVNDTHYPYENQYKDFKKNPRWKEYQALAHHPRGTWFKIHRYYAYIDSEKKEWDFTSTAELLQRNVQTDEEREKWWDEKANVEAAWEFFPKHTQAHFVINALVAYEDMLLIDEKGDELYAFPHIYAEYEGNDGPFRGWWEFLELGEPGMNKKQISLNGYKRIEKFPKKILKLAKGKLLKGKKIQLDQVSLDDYKRNGRLDTLYDTDGKYSYLKPKDIIEVPGAKAGGSEEVYFQITHIYRDKVKGHSNKRRDDFNIKRSIQQQLGREIDENEEINIYEFKRVYEHSFLPKKSLFK